MSWARILGAIASGGLSEVLPALGQVVQTIAGEVGAARKARNKARIAKLDIEREIVRRTAWWARAFVLVYLFAPDLAMLAPWISPADLAAYFHALASSQPAWRLEAKQFVVFAMWGGAELVNLGHGALRARQARPREDASSPGPHAGR